MFPPRVSVWFACKLCRCSFKSVTEFIEHKYEKHFIQFKNVTCVVFEERNFEQEQIVTLDSAWPLLQKRLPPVFIKQEKEAQLYFETDKKDDTHPEVSGDALPVFTCKPCDSSTHQTSKGDSLFCTPVVLPSPDLGSLNENQIEFDPIIQDQQQLTIEIENESDGISTPLGSIAVTSSSANLKLRNGGHQRSTKKFGIRRTILHRAAKSQAELQSEPVYHVQGSDASAKNDDDSASPSKLDAKIATKSKAELQSEPVSHVQGSDASAKNDDDSASPCKLDTKVPSQSQSRRTNANPIVLLRRLTPEKIMIALQRPCKKINNSDPLTLRHWIINQRSPLPLALSSTQSKARSNGISAHKTNVILLDPDPFKVTLGPITSSNPVRCKLCCDKFTSDQEVKGHVTNCWLYNKERHRYCVPCNKTFSRAGSLRLHSMNLHGIKIPVKKEISTLLQTTNLTVNSKEFREKLNLNKVVESCASGEKLADEVKEEDDGSKRFVCPFCNLFFRRHLVLMMHLRLDHMNKKANKQAKLSGLNFTRDGKITRPRRSHSYQMFRYQNSTYVM